MSHDRLKIKYKEEGPYGSEVERTLYCHHNHSSDIVSFHDDDGNYLFSYGDTGPTPTLMDAIIKLDRYNNHYKEGSNNEFTADSGIERWDGKTFKKSE